MSDNIKPLYFSGWNALNSTLKHTNPSCIFDIGANEGGFMETWLQYARRVHCFEPVPNMCKRIQERFGKDERVIINPVGISSSEEDIPGCNVHFAWHVAPQRDMTDVALEYKSSPPFTMRLTTLDDYINKTGERPDFIKVDTDGYELRVLQGGVKFLSEYRPPMLFEFSALGATLGDSPDSMCQLIYDLGYNAVSMDGGYVCPSPSEMMKYYPEHTSYDIMLLPRI